MIGLALPEHARILVVEHPHTAGRLVEGVIEAAVDWDAIWPVPHPQYVDRTVVLVASCAHEIAIDDMPAMVTLGWRERRLIRVLRTGIPRCVIGAGLVHPIDDVDLAFEEAQWAADEAWTNPRGWTLYDPEPNPASVFEARSQTRGPTRRHST
ncbi:hypothetical protein [Embleya sp. NPDC001921]